MEKYKELGRVTSRDMGAQFKEVIESLKKKVYVYKGKNLVGTGLQSACLMFFSTLELIQVNNLSFLTSSCKFQALAS